MLVFIHSKFYQVGLLVQICDRNFLFQGYVTTYVPSDLKILKSMLSSLPPPAEKAGLYPTAEQIEMFAYHLPDSSLQSLLVCLHCEFFFSLQFLLTTLTKNKFLMDKTPLLSRKYSQTCAKWMIHCILCVILRHSSILLKK